MSSSPRPPPPYQRALGYDHGASESWASLVDARGNPDTFESPLYMPNLDPGWELSDSATSSDFGSEHGFESDYLSGVGSESGSHAMSIPTSPPTSSSSFEDSSAPPPQWDGGGTSFEEDDSDDICAYYPGPKGEMTHIGHATQRSRAPPAGSFSVPGPYTGARTVAGDADTEGYIPNPIGGHLYGRPGIGPPPPGPPQGLMGARDAYVCRAADVAGPRQHFYDDGARSRRGGGPPMGRVHLPLVHRMPPAPYMRPAVDDHRPAPAAPPSLPPHHHLMAATPRRETMSNIDGGAQRHVDMRAQLVPVQPPTPPSAPPQNPPPPSDQCPLCNRQCEDHHRLGMFWRKFGYNGPPYCTRCSSVFRAHMVTRTVSVAKCSRDKPCSRCLNILGHFKCERTKAFKAMDAAQPKKETGVDGKAKADVAKSPCPHCEDNDHNGLGLYWRKFGYAGPAYCANCSASFRNHIIRQRCTKSDCSRLRPCKPCQRILAEFEGSREGVFNLIDNKKRAPSMPVRVGHKRPASRNDDARESGAAAAATAPHFGGTVAAAPTHSGAKHSWESAEGESRPVSKLRAVGMASMMLVGAILCWGYARYDIAPEQAASVAIVSGCTGGVERFMADDAARCEGPVGSLCYYQCLPGFRPNGTHVCLEGHSAYTGGTCFASVEATQEYLALHAMIDHWRAYQLSHANDTNSSSAAPANDTDGEEVFVLPVGVPNATDSLTPGDATLEPSDPDSEGETTESTSDWPLLEQLKKLAEWKRNHPTNHTGAAKDGANKAADTPVEPTAASKQRR
jgi:hypothetical protein